MSVLASTTECPMCHGENFFHPSTMRMSRLKLITCCHCGHGFKPEIVKKHGGKQDKQRRSQDQEKKAAKRYNAKRQPGSGSSRRAKGDFIDPDRLRGECKHTIRQSFSLKLEELIKLEKEAAAAETPLFEVQFQGVHPHKTYVVLPAEHYRALLDELERLREESIENQDHR